jgi:ribosome-associated toxin RatA of RatAB toxin-antitoxin module
MAEDSDLTEEERQQVERGEVVVRSRAGENRSAGRVWAAVAVAAPVATVWDVMIDVEHAPEFVPGLRRARRLERHESHEIIEHTVKYLWLLPEFTYRFRADYERPERIVFRRVSGDLRALEGEWTLRASADGKGTIVTYSVHLDPGFLVPQWAVRKSLQHNLPAVLRAVRERAQAGAPLSADEPPADPRP